MKKAIAMYVFLAVVMFLAPLNSIYAQTAKNQKPQQDGLNVLSAKKENYQYIEGEPGDSHLVYTYESNGMMYKVVENASENFDEINSTIYVENKNGEFVEYATQNLTIDDFELTHTTNIDGEITTESQDLSLAKSDTPSEEGVVPPIHAMSINGTCYGEPTGGWSFVSRHNGTTRISNYTVTAVVAAVIYVATDAVVKKATNTVIAMAGAIAHNVVNEFIPILYYTQSYYELKLANPGRGQENFIVGTNHYTQWYENSSRSQFMNATDQYTYHSCHTP